MWVHTCASNPSELELEAFVVHLGSMIAGVQIWLLILMAMQEMIHESWIHLSSLPS